MFIGTSLQLRDHRFPIGKGGTELLMKPTPDEQDEVYKRRALPALERCGEILAFFDNEPGNCNLARELYPESYVALLDTEHRPDAPALIDGIPRIPHFQ